MAAAARSLIGNEITRADDDMDQYRAAASCPKAFP
jgi:hypothetical protein